MGGDLGAVRGAASPRFAVLAAQGPRHRASAPGTDLQRVQIVKGWVDAGGQTHEQVFDVAGDADNGAGVDPATCAPLGRRRRASCARSGRIPSSTARSARSTTRACSRTRPAAGARFVCKTAGVDPFSPDCAAQAEAADPGLRRLLPRGGRRPFLSPLVQERAWTSPIWYRPEGIAAVRGGIDFGRGANRDALELEIRLATPPPGIDLVATPATLELVDDDTIYRTTLAANAFIHQADGSLIAEVVARGLDLSAADRVDHTVTVQLAIGTYRATHARRWVFADQRLAPVEE